MSKPKIRFKGYYNDWERRKLSEVVKEVKRTDETSDAPVMMITAENGFINQSERYSTNNAGQSLKKYILLEKGELAYNHGASKLRPFGSCFALISKGKARIPFVYHCFSSKSENAEFLSLTLNGKPVERQLRRIVSSGARMDGLLNISFEEYTAIPISLPQKAEQDRIADYFRSLDCLITLHQRQCENTKKLKKFMLQKMFPKKNQKNPEIRFAGFTNDWERSKFNDIATRESYVCISSSDIPGVEYEDVVAEEGRLNKDICSKKIVKSGIKFDGSQVLYGKLRPYLHNWLNPDFKGVAVGDWWVLKPVNMDKTFLYRLIQTQQFDNIANQSSGSKMPRADWSLISNSEFMVPLSKEEQSKIGGYFERLDHFITLHQ